MPEPMSPMKLMISYLRDAVDPLIVDPDNIVGGPLSLEQQQAGGISIVPSGLGSIVTEVPVTTARMYLRAIGNTLEQADRIANHVRDLVSRQNRIMGVNGSSGDTYEIMAMNLTAGPAVHYDEKQTWEQMLVASMMINNAIVTI